MCVCMEEGQGEAKNKNKKEREELKNLMNFFLHPKKKKSTFYE